jgi:hypothetical protein
MRRLPLLFLFAAAAVQPASELKLPANPDAARFAVIGDSGTGEPPQYQIAQLMLGYRGEFPFNVTLMLGDNIYGGKSPDDFKKKFEDPYAQLVSAGVKFYASLGNHDDSNERFYKPFNMDGARYYSFKLGNAEFFALDSNYMDPGQLDWLDKQLAGSRATWKICFFHHPLYSDGKTHGPDLDLRKQLEPIFLARGVNLVLSGHDHCYERIKPQKGIYYFVLGNSGQLRVHNLNPADEMAKGFDTDQAFALMETIGNDLYFQTISRKGETVDSGDLPLQSKNGK